MAWNESMKWVKSIYELRNKLPADEKHGLNSQMNRATVSLSSNIAEGAARNLNRKLQKTITWFYKTSQIINHQKIESI